MDEQFKIGWAENPRKGQKVFPWEMTRTPKKKSLDVVVISPKTLGCMTHWFDNRTFPHRQENCRACEANVRMEYHAYAACLRLADHAKLIVEFTERVDGLILDWLSKRRTLRGARLSLSRMGESAASKIHLKIHDTVVDLPAHVTSPDLREVLAHIWRLPANSQDGIEEHPPRIHEPKTGTDGPGGSLPLMHD